MSNTYTLVFENNSSLSANAMVYQQQPDINSSSVFSLAWFSKHVNTGKGMRAQFSWKVDYNFVWSQMGDLKPGVTFEASQVLPASLGTISNPPKNNYITFDYVTSAYEFVGQTAGDEPGTLYINQEANVPVEQASVGIGMSGFGTFVQKSEPNVLIEWIPNPTYWIAFGSYTQGQVLSVGEITSKSLEIAYPSGFFTATATLSETNTWSVSYSP